MNLLRTGNEFFNCKLRNDAAFECGNKLLYDAVRDEMTGKYSLLYWEKEALPFLQQQGLQLPGLLISHDGFIKALHP